MITANGLTKDFGGARAVDDVSFEVRPGHVTGFLGPNGAGKSTTMRMALGLETPTAGAITVDGAAYRDLAEPLRSVGALLDAGAVDGGRSAANHLRWLADSNRIDRRRVATVLDLVGLADVAGNRIGTFSLGMRQRLGIAAALLGDPGTIILDEPTNGLDPDGIAWIRNLLRNLAQEGRTVFLSSHLMSETAQTADHLIVIGQGRILADAPTSDFVTRRVDSRTRVRATRAACLSGLLTERGATVERNADGALVITGIEPTEIFRIAASHDIVLSELAPQETSLEEAFFELTAATTDYRADHLVSAA